MRIGDVVLVTGFYNNAPQFKFVRRENVILTVDSEKTNEEDLFKAVTRAKLILESSEFMRVDFTSYANTSTIPGHYVMYWELKDKNKDDSAKLDHEMMSKCCLEVEESLDVYYRTCQTKDRSIGALEIRVVRNGTFDSLMDFFVSQGVSIGQYKTPRCIKSVKALEMLEMRVVASFFSESCPSYA